jgi:hypothetical protein
MPIKASQPARADAPAAVPEWPVPSPGAQFQEGGAGPRADAFPSPPTVRYPGTVQWANTPIWNAMIKDRGGRMPGVPAPKQAKKTRRGRPKPMPG